MLSDSHAHLNGYKPEQLKQVIERAKENGIETIVAVGMNLESSEEAITISNTYDCVLAAVGIHPWQATPIDEGVYQQLKKLASKEGVVAISEVGLDFARDPSTKEVQKQAFEQHVRLAKELGLPLNLHCRGAHSEMIEILMRENASEVGGAIHGFTGDEAMLQDWLDLGFYVSIGRAILGPDASKLEPIVTKIPLDRLLIETDSYGGAAAEPGRIEPASVKLVAERVAKSRKTTVEQIGNATSANLKRLLKISS